MKDCIQREAITDRADLGRFCHSIHTGTISCKPRRSRRTFAYGTTLPSSADVWDHLLEEGHAVLPRLAQDAEVDLTSWKPSILPDLRALSLAKLRILLELRILRDALLPRTQPAQL
ncbi:hypothetical protein C8J57DRAFT_1705387 [Mycena rebaudengoi]|nr:hypothetical protein C8J57DRAFT_1705387 [Mycena rebaudengoi]